MDAAELELKFDLPDRALQGLQEYLAFTKYEETRRLTSTYFDTHERELRNACLGLRVRRGDGDPVQTLKYARNTGPLVRHEWESVVASDRPDVAALSRTPARGILKKRGGLLEPVFTTSVERNRHVWMSGNDIVEVSLDRGEITSGTRREAIQELELELKAGDPRGLFELARILNDRFKLQLMFQSKAERGYRLADDTGWEPARAHPIAIPRDLPAGDAFRELARACVAQIALNARAVSRLRASEALHQLRVGLRRFRAALTLFRSFVKDSDFETIQTETKWLASEMDMARDIDVFIEESFRRVTPELSDRSAFASFGKQLLRAQRKAYDRALAALASPRFSSLLLSTSRWLETGPWTTSGEPIIKNLRECRIDKFASNQLDRMRRAVRRRGHGLAYLDAQQQHQLRIKAKKLRYAAEFFTETFGHPKRQKRFLKSLGNLQDSLGVIHDTAVASRLAFQIVEGCPPGPAYAAGVTVEHNRNSVRKVAHSALADFDAFGKVKDFWT